MADTKYLKCVCAQCGGHIEFPAEGVGMTAPCPHCGWQTELTLETPATTSIPSSRSLKWLIAGVIILVLGLIAGVSAVLMAQRLAKKQRALPQASTRIARTNAMPGARMPARPTRAATLNDFSASEVKIEKTTGSSLVYASGTLKNETDKQRFGITVELDLFDSTGKKIGAAKDYKDALEPRGQWTFRALLVKKEVASARISDIREQP